MACRQASFFRHNNKRGWVWGLACWYPLHRSKDTFCGAMCLFFTCETKKAGCKNFKETNHARKPPKKSIQITGSAPCKSLSFWEGALWQLSGLQKHVRICVWGVAKSTTPISVPHSNLSKLFQSLIENRQTTRPLTPHRFCFYFSDIKKVEMCSGPRTTPVCLLDFLLWKGAQAAFLVQTLDGSLGVGFFGIWLARNKFPSSSKFSLRVATFFRRLNFQKFNNRSRKGKSPNEE